MHIFTADGVFCLKFLEGDKSTNPKRSSYEVPYIIFMSLFSYSGICSLASWLYSVSIQSCIIDAVWFTAIILELFHTQCSSGRASEAQKREQDTLFSCWPLVALYQGVFCWKDSVGHIA